MALFKISKGTASELLTGNNSRYAREGSAWFTTDDGKFYIDVSGDGQTTSAVIGTNRIPLNAAQADEAAKVTSSLTIKFGSSSASTENTNLFTYNGSAGKNVVITPAAIGAVAKAGDTMTGFLTLHADPTSAMHAVTKQYADGLIAAADAMVYKGTLNGGVTKADSTYTPAANAGWTYRVATAGWINDQPVEVGDLIICNTDNTPAASTTNLTNTTDVAHKWNIIQVNVDKAVYYGDSLILDGAVALFSGGSGKVKAALPTGSTTQPIYLNNGIPTAIQYTANRLYYSASKDSFEATNHYASTTKVAINSTSAPGSALHVNGTTTTTDSITVTMANTAGPKVSVSNGTYHTDLFIDTYGTNHGIYDAIANNRGTSGVTNQAAGWIIYRDNSRVYIPAWNSIGSVSKPIYIDGTGHPATVAWELKATVNSGVTNKIAYYSGANTISNGTIDTDGAYLSSVSYLNVNTAHQTTYRLYVTGESWIKGKLWTQDLYPDTDTSYDLGSSSYKWRAINLAGSAAAAGENLLTHGINIASAHIGVNTDNNTLAIDSIGNVEIRPSTGTITTNGIIFTHSAVYANRNNIVDLGTNISLWKDIYGHNLILKRIAGQKNGVIKFYSPGYNIWSVYMDTADVAGGAPNGATTSRLGNVTTWSLHSYIENTSGYGWIWESSDKDSETTPTPRMGLSSANGQLRIASNATTSTNESGGLIISSAENGSNGNISLELWRGVNASWQIANEGGTLYFRNNWTNAKQTTYSQVALVMDYNTGASSIPYLAIGQTDRNTSYRLYVKGTTAHTDDIYLIGDATRNIYYQGTNTNKSMIRFVNGDANGHAIYIGGGALTVIGSGEFASSFSTTSTSETLYLLSDGAINIEAGADSISNRIGLQITGAGHLLPVKAEAANNLVQDIGSNTYRWRNVYANALHLQGPSSDPSASAGARIVFSYDASTNVGGSQPVYLSYTPNDSYRAAAGLKAWSSESPFWFEIAGDLYVNRSIGINNTTGTGQGISLYGGATGDTAPTYGLLFAKTENRGKWADVQSDWATYFTMSDTAQRGWIWQANTTDAGMAGALSRRGVFTARAYARAGDAMILAPNGGYFKDTASSKTGALKITLPQLWSNTMLRFVVDIYDFSANNGVSYYIGGYNYSVSSAWVYVFAYSDGVGDKSNLTVRFGHDGSKACIVIGETNTVWSYPKVSIRNVMIGHVGDTISNWSTGWSLSWITALPTVQSTLTNVNKVITGTANRLPYYINELSLAPGNHYASNTKIAINSTSEPTYNLHVAGDSYVTGWSRAASGFYCQNTGVHYTHQGNHGEIDIQNSDELMVGSYNTAIHINHRAVARGKTPTTWYWKAGTGTTYATFYVGHILPGVNATYDLGNSGSLRWRTGYFNTSILVGTTSYTGSTAAAFGTYISQGCIEMSGATPFIDFHNANSTADFTGRIIADNANGLSITPRLGINAGAKFAYTLYCNGPSSFTNHILMYTPTAGANAYGDGSAIEVREVNMVYTSQNAWSYAPKIGFHWGGRYQGTFGLHSNGAYYLSISAGQGNATLYAGSVYGAVWNDYAEYRIANTKEPGRVIKETPTGEMTLTTQRLEKGCEIISDTYGFAIGEDDKAKTPTAATGRVLAYTDKPRETFELGMPVCSGPNGTVSQMTEEEARMYPWCIIGTVSEIPTYEEWGSGNVKVNERIWIRIR